jgi:hypothetical protein
VNHLLTELQSGFPQPPNYPATTNNYQLFSMKDNNSSLSSSEYVPSNKDNDDDAETDEENNFSLMKTKV